jgi:hypothetical protein
VAVAIGVVLEATTPRTEPEDRVFGSARDRLVGSARELTEDTMAKVGRVVDKIQTTATEEAKKESLISRWET